MPVRERRPEDERPLFRAVNERRLIGPVGGGQDSGKEAEGTGGPGTAARTGEAPRAEEGPVSRAVSRAEQNNWVYPSMAKTARERGLLDKADEVFERLRAQLGGR